MPEADYLPIVVEVPDMRLIDLDDALPRFLHREIKVEESNYKPRTLQKGLGSETMDFHSKQALKEFPNARLIVSRLKPRHIIGCCAVCVLPIHHVRHMVKNRWNVTSAKCFVYALYNLNVAHLLSSQWNAYSPSMML